MPALRREPPGQFAERKASTPLIRPSRHSGGSVTSVSSSALPLARISGGTLNAMKGWGLGVSSYRKRRLERLWCGRLHPASGSLRGGLSVCERRGKAGKCDSLSFLRVFLSQMDSVRGGTNGHFPLIEDSWPGCLRELGFDLKQRVSRQSSLCEGALRVSWSSHWGQP